MAQITYIYPIQTIQGKLNKKECRGIICRQKYFYDADGNILGSAIPEGYVVKNPRDYTKKPPKGAELAHIQAFRQAALRVKTELADPERHAYWLARWRAQLQHGDPTSPINPITHQPKIYLRLDKFILASLLRDIKQTP